ncbi:MAG: biotin/lipoyl-binding protein, partial [Firmicutes bacterium]|nr:biotin/lipoyl-binding protein [Bacillota bacterium]
MSTETQFGNQPRRRPPTLALAVIGAVAIVVAGVYGYTYWVKHTRYFETENAKIAGDLVQVSAEGAGRVSRVNVDIGSKVKAGDVLATLDDELARAQLAQAQAALELARAQRARVLGGARAEELRRAEDAVAGATAQRDLARKMFENTQALFQHGAASQAQFDQAHAQYKAAEATLSQAQAALDALRAGATNTDVAVADAAVKQADAAVRLAEVAVNNTRVTAPEDGTIIQVNVKEGEMAAPGQPLAV